MDTLRRVLLALFGLCFAAAAAVVAVALVNHNFGANLVFFFDKILAYNMQQHFVQSMRLWLPILFGLLFLAIAVALLYVAFHRTSAPRNVRVQTEDGNNIEITKEAIESVVKKAVASLPDVNGVSSRMRIIKGELLIKLNLVVPAGSVIPEVGQAARTAVSEQLQTLLNVTPKEIRVEISNISDAEKANNAADADKGGAL